MTLMIGLSSLVTQKNQVQENNDKTMRKMLLLLKHDATFVLDGYKKSQKEPEIGLKSSKFRKKAKPSSRIKKPGIKDKHEHDMAIFNQARGQTWNRSSAETYPPLL